MTSTALVRSGVFSDLELVRMQLKRILRDEITRNNISIDFPIEKTPRKWYVGTLACFVRSGRMTTNGYVAVPESHPWYKIHYTECPIRCGETWCDHSPVANIEVHGGITYSGLAAEGWVFGFDTGHYNDYIPAIAALLPFDSPFELHHWDTSSVAAETTRMAEQLEKVRALIYA